VARAIIRYSFDGPAKGTRSKAREVLRSAGFIELGTASFEVRATALPDVVDALHELLNVVKDPAAGVSLDHLWVYLDEASEANHPV
jgi:hypothetical protein